MEHHIYGCNVLTNVQHYVRGRAMVDDFIVLNMNHWEAAAHLGNLTVDETSLMRLIQWGIEERDGIAGNFVLLISIDGKYGAVGLREDIDKPKTGSEMVYIGEVYAPIRGIKAQVAKNVKLQPELAHQLNLRAFQKAIPDRIFFRTGAEFGPGVISAEVWDATNNIESASDDALVWIKMLGVNPKKGLTVEVVDRALSELELRIAKGYGLHSTFFPVTEVTMKEIGARGRRAQRGMESFLTKFPSERDLQLDEDQVKERRRQVERYRSRLSNDRLVEVIVFLSFKAEWLGDSYKTFLGEFYDRAARGGE
jgi:hypothetical protein